MKPVTKFTPLHRERAEAKRARRRVRNIRQAWQSGYVFNAQEMQP